MDETKLTASLPNLSVGIMRRSLPEENAEVLMVALKATPSLDALVAGWLQPMAVPLALWTAPLVMWNRLAQAAWQPWLAALDGRSRD